MKVTFLFILLLFGTSNSNAYSIEEASVVFLSLPPSPGVPGYQIVLGCPQKNVGKPSLAAEIMKFTIGELPLDLGTYSLEMETMGTIDTFRINKDNVKIWLAVDTSQYSLSTAPAYSNSTWVYIDIKEFQIKLTPMDVFTAKKFNPKYPAFNTAGPLQQKLAAICN